MPDVREFQNVVESAEQAAAKGDIAGAEALLREAATLQEASHGPLHPDLASTFNNLAVVCEMAHKPIDAEQFYRRAYAIASWSLSPGHPMVATARDNLRDFCVARGLPIEEWMDMRTGAHVAPPTPAAAAVTPATAVAPTAAPISAAVPAPPPPRPTSPARVAAAAPPRTPRPTPPAAGPRSRRGLGVAVAIVGVLAVVAGVRVWLSPASTGAVPSDVARMDEPVVPTPAVDRGPAVEAAPVTSAPVTSAPAAAAAAREVAPPPPTVPVAALAPSDSPAASPGVRVVTATVCTSLSTGAAWRCTAAGDTTAPGRLSYYTRVASRGGLRVRHRWYQGDRLRQDVALSISANAVDGYRTFSRQTVAPGEWRVEMRDDNGALLDAARFVVR